MNVSIPFTSQSACLLLTNLFVPEEINLIEEPDFYQETKFVHLKYYSNQPYTYS